MTTKSFVKAFAKPDTSYYPNLMWFWNDRITKEEIDFQLGEFKKSEIYEFFVHPLWGFEMDYLDDNFFDLIKYTVKVAKENGMKFWIYDDYCWPSGIAGGLLLKEKPETDGVVLLTKRILLYAAQPLDTDIEGEFVGALAVHKNKVDRYEDITPKVKKTKTEAGYHIHCDIDGCSNVTVWLSYTAKSIGLCAGGMWSKFSDYQGGWLDANDKNAAKAFLDSTYEKYKEAIGDEFGKTVKGSFSDEANNFCFFDMSWYEQPAGSFPVTCWPWTREFLKVFKEKNGYDFEPYAYALGCDFFDATVMKVRYDFWNVFSRLFADNYLKQIASWCRENHIALTGHLSGEESLMWHSYQMGDSFLALSQFEMPGIDNLFSVGYVDQLMFTLTAKLAVTAAKLARRPRVMCETFSGSGWDTKLQEIRRCLQRLITAGVNLTQYMGAYYSLNEGRRRYNFCYPPSHGYNNPLFKYYGEINKEMGRLNAVSAASVIDAKIFVVLPVLSEQINKALQPILDTAWHNTANALVYGRYEYDVASERALEDAKVKDGKMVIKGFEYEQLIIPAMHYTTSAFIKLLKKYIKQGGKVLFINKTDITAADTGDVYGFKKDVNGKNVRSLFFEGAEGEPKNLIVNLKKAIGDIEPLTITNDVEKVYYSHRKNGGDDVFFITNDNDRHLELDVKLLSDKNVYMLDYVDGSVYEVKTKKQGGAARFKLTSHSYSTAVILATENKIDALKAPKDEDVVFEKEITLDKGWKFKTADDNWAIMLTKMLPSSPELLKIKDKKAFANACVKDLENAGNIAYFELPGGFGIHVGESYAACGLFTIEDMPSRLKLIIETEDGCEVLVNGNDVTKELKHIKLWGIREKEADIIKYAREGVNTLVFVSKVPAWKGPHVMPASYLKGDFRLGDNVTLQKPQSSIKPDIWTKQGYRNYSGDATYTTTFELDAVPKCAMLTVPTSDMVKVVVNGVDLGRVYVKPHEVDIAKALKVGKNTIELVFTSCFKSLMLAEDYDLYYQGYLKYLGESAPVESGLTAAPVIKIGK